MSIYTFLVFVFSRVIVSFLVLQFESEARKQRNQEREEEQEEPEQEEPEQQESQSEELGHWGFSSSKRCSFSFEIVRAKHHPYIVYPLSLEDQRDGATSGEASSDEAASDPDTDVDDCEDKDRCENDVSCCEGATCSFYPNGFAKRFSSMNGQ